MKNKKCIGCGSAETLILKNRQQRQYVCADCNRKYSKSYYDRCKILVFNHYGGECNCCGESMLLFLTIDHTDNNGHGERWPSGQRICGRQLYSKLVSRGFPAGYQILCSNCNHGKRMNNGVCPHKNPIKV